MRKAQSGLTVPASLALMALLVLLILLPDQALAASTGGGGLQWETPLQKIRDSITGPVAYAVSLMGIVVTGAILVFGGEINEFVRRIIMLVLVVSLMVFATDLLSTLFNAGAVIR
ncbi:MAG: TrbC/VirB2 family protein [Rhodomicrobium sp.]|nr:TrbC/VirB2 family protein [Rhodomicrobium sp.]